MKLRIYALFIMFSLLEVSCASENIKSKTLDYKFANCCSESVGERNYNRDTVLHLFANTLNLLLPKWGIEEKGFSVNGNCQLPGVFIWDLNDTLNKETTLNECIALKEGHIYHFSPMRNNHSYSNIAILNENKVKIFKAINCPAVGDKIEDVIKYVQDNLRPVPEQENLISRLKSYRKYGVYLRVDEQSEFNCQ